MSSPAGQAWLQGASRLTYSARSVRQLPVLLARLEPTSSVIAYGCSVMTPPSLRSAGSRGEQPHQVGLLLGGAGGIGGAGRVAGDVLSGAGQITALVGL